MLDGYVTNSIKARAWVDVFNKDVEPYKGGECMWLLALDPTSDGYDN